VPKVGADDFIEHTRATAADLEALSRLDFWPRLDPDALQGLAGDFVVTIDPYTEADPGAVLGHLVVAFGNLIGDRPHARVQHDQHPARLNIAFVGRTSKGRKGMAFSPVHYVFSQVARQWSRDRIKTGLSSGEGLIYHVRDAREELKTVRRDRKASQERVLVDEGEPDKRLLVVEPEFAVVLKRMAGEGNSLSGVMRQAWDTGNLATLTKNSPVTATGAHVSVIAHITEEELRRYLTETERANGFGNRFLWLLVKRSKLLPRGAPVPDDKLEPLIARLGDAVTFARSQDDLSRTRQAEALWADVYPGLTEGEPGLVGAILSRAEAQVLRLSLVYALLDRSDAIETRHLRAALALWRYAEASARRIFGGRLGAPLADTILGALQTRGAMSETDLWALLGRHRTAEEIHAALDSLARVGKVRSSTKRTKGRPAVIWEASQ